MPEPLRVFASSAVQEADTVLFEAGQIFGERCQVVVADFALELGHARLRFDGKVAMQTAPTVPVRTAMALLINRRTVPADPRRGGWRRPVPRTRNIEARFPLHGRKDSESMQSEPAAQRDPVESTAAPRPVSGRRAALFSILALEAGIAATVWFEQVKYERFPGYLQARQRTVSAARDAQISEILVSPEAVVTAGQPLVRLKNPAFEQRLEAKQRQIEALEIELSQSQARLEVELEWRQKNILEHIFEARLKCVQALRRELQAPLELEYVRTGSWNSLPAAADFPQPPSLSGDRPLITQTAGDSASVSPQPQVTEVGLCTEHIQELERINRELPEKISRSMEVDLARTRLEHAQAELSRLESQKQELTLVAEASGMVGVFQKEVGDHVSAHEPIVQLLDEEQPYLLLQIPSVRISDFSPGTVVELRFPGGKKGKGRVEEIPPQTSPIPGENSAAAGTVITAHVDPVGPLWPSLPFGSVVEVRRRR